IANNQRQAVLGEGNEIVAIAAEGPNLAAPPAAVQGAGVRPGPCINRCCTWQASTQSWLTSTTASAAVISQPPLVGRFRARELDRAGPICGLKKGLSEGCRERRGGSD